MSTVDGDNRSFYRDRRSNNQPSESFASQRFPRHQREVDDLDYIVPRSGRYFEGSTQHDDRDVWTPGQGPPGERHVQRPRPPPRIRENPYKLVYGSAGAGPEAPARELHHNTRPERTFREQGDRFRGDRGQLDRSFHGHEKHASEPPVGASRHIDDIASRDRKYPAFDDSGRYGERQSTRQGYLADDADRDNGQAGDARHSSRDRFEGRSQHGRWSSYPGPPDRQEDWNADPGHFSGRDTSTRFNPGQRDMRNSRYEPYGRAPAGFGRGGRGRFASADGGKWKHDKFEELQNPPEEANAALNDAAVVPNETEQEAEPSRHEGEDGDF